MPECIGATRSQLLAVLAPWRFTLERSSPGTLALTRHPATIAPLRPMASCVRESHGLAVAPTFSKNITIALADAAGFPVTDPRFTSAATTGQIFPAGVCSAAWAFATAPAASSRDAKALAGTPAASRV